MERYAYIAQDLAGTEKKGLTQGTSREEVYTWLSNQGLIPVEVRLVASVAVSSRPGYGRKRPKYMELSTFCWQLSTMIEGGVLITEAIDIISEDIENLSFRYTLMDIAEQIKTGESFSDSVSAFPRVFERLFCSMILAGETSGSLPTVLRRLAEYYDNRAKFVRKLKSALTYPVFVVGVVFIIIILMMTLIIPKFRLIFDDMGGELPAFTQMFMNVYDVIVHQGLYVGALLASLIFLGVAYCKTPHGHMRLGKLVLRTPLLGKISTQAFVATFCKTMATLLAAGVSIIESFNILSEMTNNDVIKAAVVQSKELLIEGSSISVGIASSGFFPNMVSRMIEVGEKSGSLPEVLDRASSYYETKMDATITTLLNLLGPIVILLVGAIVLVIVVALYLPVFSMSDFA